MREIAFRDLGHYKRILREAFSAGPGREATVDALLKAVDLYRFLFFALKPLGRLGMWPTVIPRVFVCERDGQAVAALCVRRLGRRYGPLFLVHLAVDEACRRHGIATRLLSHVEATLPGQSPQLILTRVLEDNQPQLRNRLQAGFTEYARQTRFTWNDGGRTGAKRDPGEGGLDMAHGNEDESHLPTSRQIAELQQRHAPGAAREVAVCSNAGAAEGSHLLHGIFPSRRRWRAGYARQGRLVAGAMLSYHQLQHTYELDLAAEQGTEDLVYRLLNQAQARMRGSNKVLNVKVHDYESTVTAVLTRCGFIPGETRILLCKRRLP